MLTTRKVIDEVLEHLGTQLSADFEAYRKNHEIDFVSASYDDAHTKAESVLADLKSIASAVNYENKYFLPKFFANFKSFEEDGKLDRISMSVKTPRNSEVKVGNTFTISADNIIGGMQNAIQSTLIQIAMIQFAIDNIAALNSKLSSIMTEAGCNVQFRFALGDNYVEDINNAQVVFGATMDAAFDVSSLTVMREFTEDTNELAKMPYESEVETITESIKGMTAPQIVKLNLSITNTMTGSKPLNRADKLLRQRYRSQAKYFTSSAKEAVGYSINKTTVGDEEVTLFSVLAKDKEGKVYVKLSPFNIKTNLYVDYDILNHYKDAE